ncbi:hypothetical protein F8M41_022324 [Gigaspora margarita]|uniref:Uncharacterized protein n=1 Tax=Gigaspora margarita TaxID=4874 RepID=A0A8H4EI41_GIGMA|nr:hypothetical protein F8M41_022324 [Gigaspora margarita]
MRKNKPANGAQRDHKNHEPINQLPIIGDHNKLVAIRQTHGAQHVTKVHDQHVFNNTYPNHTPLPTNKSCLSNNRQESTTSNRKIVMTIKDLEKEIEQYDDNQCINKQAEKLDQHVTDVTSLAHACNRSANDDHKKTLPKQIQINKLNPTKKYPVHKEQKDIREKLTEQPKENWVNQKYNRKLH